MKWGVKEYHVAVTALHNCGKSHSQIFELLKLSKISRKFLYWVIKHYKELWRVAYMARSGHLNVRGLIPLSKQCRSRFAEIYSGNRRSCPES